MSASAYTLYGDRWSGSMIVEMALAWAQVPYALHEVSLLEHAQDRDTYRRINPHGKLPALQAPSGEVLTETTAIVLTLDERIRSAGLLPPPGSPDRAHALRWFFFVATEAYPLVEIFDYPSRFAPEGSRPEAMQHVAQAHWRRRWMHVEEALAGEPWLLERGPTIVDGYIALVSMWTHQKAWRAESLPKITRLTEAVREHAAMGPVWKRHANPPPEVES